MTKPINRKQQKRFYQWLAVILYVTILYFGAHLGHVTQGAALTAEHIMKTLDNCIQHPFNMFPTHMDVVKKSMIAGVIAPLFVYTEYLRRRDLRPMEESGSARWNDDLRKFYQTYTEMTAWPRIFDRFKFLQALKRWIIRANECLSKLPVVRFVHQKVAMAVVKKVEHPDEGTGSKNMIFSKDVFMSMNTRKTMRNNNVTCIGGSGSGKSRFVAKPNLLQANCSFVVTDPSGELLESTGQFLIDQGYDVRVFNLVEMEHSHCYNPFHYIRNQEGVLIMINALIKNTTPKGSSTNDPFWEKAETALLQAICFFLISECNKEDQNFSSVMKLLRCAKANEGQEDVESTLDIMFRKLKEREPEHIAVQSYAVFKSAGGGKTAQSILISCQTRLQTFNLDAIKNLTNIDNIDLGSIGDKKTALFCITPSADTTFNYLVALLYTQLFETLYFHAETQCAGKRLPCHVRFILDEFANVGTIPEFSQKLATMRKYEISCTIIIQALSQIKAMYKDDWEVLIGNCDSLLFLGGADATTLEYISKTLGKETIRSVNNSRSYGKQGSHSLSYNKTGRELLTPDELRVMDNTNCVLFIRGLYPFFTVKYPYEKHPNYPKTGDANKKLLFDVKKMLTTGRHMLCDIKPDESRALRVFKDAQRSDTREEEREFRYNSRPVEYRSARGRELGRIRKLSEDIPHIDLRSDQRIPEQEAEYLAATENLTVEEISTPSEEELMKLHQYYMNSDFFGMEEDMVPVLIPEEDSEMDEEKGSS